MTYAAINNRVFCAFQRWFFSAVRATESESTSSESLAWPRRGGNLSGLSKSTVVLTKNAEELSWCRTRTDQNCTGGAAGDAGIPRSRWRKGPSGRPETGQWPIGDSRRTSGSRLPGLWARLLATLAGRRWSSRGARGLKARSLWCCEAVITVYLWVWHLGILKG